MQTAIESAHPFVAERFWVVNSSKVGCVAASGRARTWTLEDDRQELEMKEGKKSARRHRLLPNLHKCCHTVQPQIILHSIM